MKMIALALSLAAAPALADWQLNNDASNLNFMSTKNEHIMETHQFERLNGSLTEQGKASIEIDLTSVNTLIPIRNERMLKHLFETANFAKATITADFSVAKIKQLSVGESQALSLKANLNLHGETKPLGLDVIVTKTTTGLLVNSQKPVVIDARHYQMGAGVDTLKSLAGLSSIGYTVPVTFNLTFADK